MLCERLLRVASVTSLAFAPLLSQVGCSADSSTPPPLSTPTQDAGGTPEASPDNGVDTGVEMPPDATGAQEDVAVAAPDAPGDDAAVSAGPDSAVVDSMADLEGAVGGKHVVFVWGYGEHLATPAPTAPLEPLDVQMKALLEAKGLVVDLAEDKISTVAEVTGKALLVISSSVNRLNLTADGTQNGAPRFKDVPVPAIVMKDGVIEVMGLGMGSSGGFSTGLGQTQLTIVAAAGDPLAAGLMGNVTVYTTMGGQVCPMCYTGHVMNSDRIIYSFPSPSADKIATIVGQPTQVAIFAYAAGAMMAGGFAAPAKRMGFFIHRDTQYGPDGVKLFDAAVDYLLAP